MARTLKEKLTGKRGGKVTKHSGRAGTRHDHKFTIGDEDAFVTLIEKNTTKLTDDRRERLLNAVRDATRRFKASSSKERDSFLHGLVTGYAVGFKLAEECATDERASTPPRADAKTRSTAAGTMGVA